VVELKIGHFGDNALVQFENQQILGVQRLPFRLPVIRSKTNT
jgi:hypothetical protein